MAKVPVKKQDKEYKVEIELPFYNKYIGLGEQEVLAAFKKLGYKFTDIRSVSGEWFITMVREHHSLRAKCHNGTIMEITEM